MGAPEGSPAASIEALRPAHDPRTLIVTIRGLIDRSAAARFGDEIGDLLRAAGTSLVVCDVGGVTEANAAAVDAVCRVRLAARRLGCRLRLRHASPELVDLLDLMGLCDVVDDVSGHDASSHDGSLPEGSGLEGEGQPKQREHARRVEEERDPADPPA